MNQLELSASPPTAPATWNRESAAKQIGAIPPVRELSRLIADIRRARALLDAAGAPDEPVTLEHVVGNDPRD
ncbi:hypothetical protein [Anatilimnocola floriformis]|uniref:hypothetical protein n=1 Tax=Anatilimnocola floriformis TaxID=2948575 RepID=UPI0020C4A3B8|nr:hypothetical protein [Anatilimnocola floriformis]